MKTIMLNGEVSDDWLAAVLKARHGDVVVINSPGGSASTARAVAHHVALLGLDTVAMGAVDSAAIPIFASGCMRYSYPGTTFLWHAPYLEVAEGLTATGRQCEVWSRSLNRWLSWACGLLTRKATNACRVLWRDLADAEGHEFTAHNFLDFGLVDKLITDIGDSPFQPPKPASDGEDREKGGDQNYD